MIEQHYSIGYSCNEDPSNVKFQLHNHDEYELLLFLEGDARYVVEEKNYTLEPGDIILIRKHEMHRIYHNRPACYRRIIMMVAPEFFKENHCQEYETQFIRSFQGKDNKIGAEQVKSSGLLDAFERYQKYSEEYTLKRNNPILVATVIEILYLVNKIAGFSAADLTNNPMKPVMLYLNNCYTEDITLDALEEKFYMSKYYLCRAFRKATGLTIQEYIRKKRLTKVRELKNNGMSISEAALNAGFHDYSSFYRAYLKEYGIAPRKDML